MKKTMSEKGGGTVITLSSSITELKGIGKVRAAAFEKLGIKTLRDVLYHFPRAYQNRGDVRSINELRHGDVAALMLTVATVPRNAMIKRGMTLTKFRGYDDTDSIEIVFFNQPYLKDVFEVGEQYRFYGKITAGKRNVLMLSSPTYEKCTQGVALRDFVPIYPLSEGLNTKVISEVVAQALKSASSSLADPLPESIRRFRRLATLSYAIRNIHQPPDMESLRAAGRRLAYDEMFYYALCASAFSKKHREGRSFFMEDTDVSEFLRQIPFSLTSAQQRCIDEIRADLSCTDMSVPAMSRIVVGDVGSGKTVCAAAALYISAKNGMQAAMMAPTEILATQHYHDLMPLFESLGIKCELLCGSTKKSEKDRIRRALATEGEDRCDIVIGTHAVISEGVEFSRLGLVITDEQHRFGVKQRQALSEKGKGVHTLVMSATPIPRTMSLVMYKDIDVSIIDVLPAGRMRVDTFWVNESYRERLNAFIRKQIEQGGQVYIVCPTVERSDDDDEDGGGVDAKSLFELALGEDRPPLKAAVDYAKELSEKVFSDIPVGFLHGRMKPAKKDEVMGRFVRGEIKILVSTTVIEVGVNVPSATLMIVENAERFGLSQLHQLRGRVGRGNKKSYCVLVSDSKGETAKGRLTTMKNTYDGFAIAEKDLRMRGPGDFFAVGSGSDSRIRQSGENAFRMSGMCSDEGLMEAAFEDARAVYEGVSVSEGDREVLLSYAGAMYDVGSAALN